MAIESPSHREATIGFLSIAAVLVLMLTAVACSTVRVKFDDQAGIYVTEKGWSAVELIEGTSGDVVTFKNSTDEPIRLRFDVCCVSSPLTLPLTPGEKGTVTLRQDRPGPNEDCPECVCQCCNYVIEGPEGGHGGPTMIVKEGP